MTKIFLLITALFFTTPLFAQDTEVIRLSEPVYKTETYEIFGEKMEVWDEAETLSSIINDDENFRNKMIILDTEVVQVCEKKGCFFIVNDGEYSARVTFKDYGFFIPTDAKGKKVKLAGIFNVKELSEEQAKHYAEDAGENPENISGVQYEYSIVATSVLIPRKP